jgi:hypothetical protein
MEFLRMKAFFSCRIWDCRRSEEEEATVKRRAVRLRIP